MCVYTCLVTPYRLNVCLHIHNTHGTHLLNHIRKPQRKPHWHRIVPYHLTIATHPLNFPCHLLLFNWLGDFSVLSRYPRVIVSIVTWPLFPLLFSTYQNSWLLQLYAVDPRPVANDLDDPTFVSDKRCCNPYRYSSSSRTGDGQKSEVWHFDINVVYKSEICEVLYTCGHIYLLHLFQCVCHSTLASRYTVSKQFWLHYNWWYGGDIKIFRTKTCYKKSW